MVLEAAATVGMAGGTSAGTGKEEVAGTAHGKRGTGMELGVSAVDSGRGTGAEAGPNTGAGTSPGAVVMTVAVAKAATAGEKVAACRGTRGRPAGAAKATGKESAAKATDEACGTMALGAAKGTLEAKATMARATEAKVRIARHALEMIVR